MLVRLVSTRTTSSEFSVTSSSGLGGVGLGCGFCSTARAQLARAWAVADREMLTATAAAIRVRTARNPSSFVLLFFTSQSHCRGCFCTLVCFLVGPFGLRS